MKLIAQIEKMNEGYGRFMPIRELDGAAIRQAKVIFDGYKQSGIIINGEFSDMSWTLSNEVQKVGLTLIKFEGGSKKIAMSWIGCTYPRYILYVKAYILFNLGELSLAALQELSRCFNRLVLQTSEEAAVLTDYTVHIVALLQLIPNSNTQRD